MTDISASAPELIGLILAGGRSRRMRVDKGGLIYAGEPQVRRILQLLESRVDQVLVSVRRAQLCEPCYTGLSHVVDDERFGGPAAGLAAAWARFPRAALLVVAVDLPLVDAMTLDALIAGRDAAKQATAFQHPDGTLEPLCALWEASATSVLDFHPGDRGPSLRAALTRADIVRLEPPGPQRLKSANTEAQYLLARRLLEG
jgi:molybdopterin-guanine dinucleotide biosynthesis protein A